MVTIRIILALAATHKWSLFQMDVYNVFLQGDLFEEVYMEVTPGFCNQGETGGETNLVCRLLKCLHGLKQSSR